MEVDIILSEVKKNLKSLSKFTILNSELALTLYQEDLITETQLHYLRDDRTANITRASFLYTDYCKQWKLDQWHVFSETLESSRNGNSFEFFDKLLATDKAKVVVFKSPFTFNELKLITRLRHERGKFEGLSYDDESDANDLKEWIKMFNILEDGEISLCDTEVGAEERKNEIVERVKRVSDNMSNCKLWWNRNDDERNIDYIPRKVSRNSTPCTLLEILPQETTLLEATLAQQGRIILLLSEAGMGKTVELIELEKRLREAIKQNRIIIRVKLREIQTKLPNAADQDDLNEIINILKPELKLCIEEMEIIILFDCVDEVCPKHEESLISITRKVSSFHNTRIVLASRRHPESVVKSILAMKAESWSLFPFSPEEQSYFVRQRLKCFRSVQMETFFETFPESVKEVLSKPLLLDMIVRILTCNFKFLQDVSEVNLFTLFTGIVKLCYERHFVEKHGMDPEANLTEDSLNSISQRYLEYYYEVVMQEMGQCDSEENELLDKKQKQEMLRFGLLVECDGRLQFNHRSFTQYFCAQMIKSGWRGKVSGKLAEDGEVKQFLNCYEFEHDIGTKINYFVCPIS